jgi:hypothetical protein
VHGLAGSWELKAQPFASILYIFPFLPLVLPLLFTSSLPFSLKTKNTFSLREMQDAAFGIYRNL